MTKVAARVNRREQFVAYGLCVVSGGLVVALTALPGLAHAAGVGVSSIVGGGVVALDVIAVLTRGHR